MDSDLHLVIPSMQTESRNYIDTKNKITNRHRGNYLDFFLEHAHG